MRRSPKDAANSHWEKVVFSPGQLGGYGIKLGLLEEAFQVTEDDNVSISIPVVESMSTPIPVYYPDGSYDTIQVGDVLFALNGELLRKLSKQHITKLLTLYMPCTVSFMDSEHYHHLVKLKQLSSIVRPSPRGFLSSVYSAMPSISSYWSRPSVDPVLARKHQKVVNAAKSMASLLSSNKAECIADQAFALQSHEYAVQMYTSALSRKPKSFHIYAKRAMAYLKLNRLEESLKDSNLCIALRPEWPMGYLCKAFAYWVALRQNESFAALACGLTVDPSNPSLQLELTRLLASISKSLVVLTDSRYVEPISEALSERGVKAKIEKIALVASGSLEMHAEFAPYVISGQEYVMLLQTPPNSGLSDGDLIYSVNATSMASFSYGKICEEYGINGEGRDELAPGTCQIVGLVNRWSASAPQTREASKSVFEFEQELGMDGSVSHLLKTYKVTNCGTWYANGVYIPQEEQNGLYVYENEYGCLLSVEQPSDNAKGWVIGRNGIILYAKSVSSRVRDVENELHSLHPRWCVFKGRHPPPSIERYHSLPELEVFTGDSTQSLRWKDWSSFSQLLALKGYAHRAGSAKKVGVSMELYKTLQSRLVELIQVESQLHKATDDSLYYKRFLLRVLINMGKLLYDQGKYKAAYKVLQEASSLERNCALKTYFLAITLVKMGRRTEALERVKEGLETTSLPGMQYELGKEELKLLKDQLEAKKGARVKSPIQLQQLQLLTEQGPLRANRSDSPTPSTDSQTNAVNENKRRGLRMFKKRLTSNATKPKSQSPSPSQAQAPS